MNIAFGIILLMFSAGITAWAVASSRIAAVPIIARMMTWLDGGYNVPSDAAVDELMAMAARRKAAGVHDRDELMRGTNMSYREHYESTLAPLAVSEAAIDAVPDAAASS